MVQTWVVPMGSKPIIGSPKTEAGVRTLTIPPNVSRPWSTTSSASSGRSRPCSAVRHLDRDGPFASQLQPGLGQGANQRRPP